MPVGGLGDLSFSWTAQLGVEKIKKELHNVNISTVEPSKAEMLKSSYQYYIDNKAKMIIGIGFQQEKIIKEMAKKNPGIKFVIIDAFIDLPNVTSITFKEEEGSFLAGCTAAMVSKSGKIGFIGAMDIDLIKKFKKGYEEGAKYINSKIEIDVKYIGKDESAFSSPDKAKKIANDLYDNGLDVIFSAAGGSGLGVIDSAQIKDKYCIGVDSDQDYLSPGNVITSMMKRVDNAIYFAVDNYSKGKLNNGHITMGLKDGGVSLTEFKYSQSLMTQEQIKKIDQIKQDIIKGKIIIKL
jgi:basic membrane protein A